jgi:hypothetical protein
MFLFNLFIVFLNLIAILTEVTSAF